MLVVRPYNRMNAIRYAERWAFEQNPLFADFEEIGGNCTNFVSQCVYAGSCQMNYLSVFGWYYISLDDRTASWSGVKYFYNFLVENMGLGPFGREVSEEQIEIGDVIQLYRERVGFYHSLIVVGFSEEGILVAAQSDDAYGRALSSYSYDRARFLKIDGVRINSIEEGDCFQSVYDGVAILPSR